MKKLLITVIAAAVGTIQAASGSSLLVLNKSENTLAVVDPSTRQVIARMSTGMGPHEIVVTPDGKTAFVSNYGDGANPGRTISMLDLSAHRETRRVDVSPFLRPHGLFLSGGKVYFSAETNRAIARYDPATDKIDLVLGTGQSSTHMVVASSDGSRLFTSNIGSDSISIFERTGTSVNWSHTVVPVGKGPEGLDLSPDGRELWTAHSQDGGVSVIDLASKKVVATIDARTGRSNRIKLTIDGKSALISDINAGEVVVLDTARRQVSKRIPVGRSPEGILMAPDGRTAYVAVTGDDHVAVLDLQTLEVTGRISTGSGPDGLAWQK